MPNLMKKETETKPALRWSRRCQAGLLSVVVFTAASLAVSTLAGASPWPSTAQRAQAALRSGEEEQKWEALKIAATLSPALAGPVLEVALKDPSWKLREAAAQLALAFELTHLAPLVETWFAHPRARVRMLALELTRGSSLASRIELMGAMLRDPEPGVRILAADCLAQSPSSQGQRAAQLVLSAMDDEAPEVRAAVARALGRLGQPLAAIALAGRTGDSDEAVRQQVVLALGALAEPNVLGALLRALGDSAEPVVLSSIRVLSLSEHVSATAGLLNLLQRSEPDDVARAAVAALGWHQHAQAQQGLMRLLSDPSYRSLALSALLTNPANSLPGLQECLEQAAGPELAACVQLALARDTGAQAVTAAILDARLGPLQAFELFLGREHREVTVLALEALTGTDSALRRGALVYLRSHRQLPAEAAPALADALKSRRLSQRDKAAVLEALSNTYAAADRQLLAHYLEAKDERQREAAAKALVSSKAAGRELVQLLASDDQRVAGAALSQLARHVTADQKRTLLNMLRSGASVGASSVIRALASVSPGRDSEVLEVLQQRLANVHGAERDNIWEAMSRVADATDLLSIAADGNPGDLMKLSQLAHFHSQGDVIARAFLKQPSPRLVAVCLEVLGRKGHFDDLARYYESADELSRHPHFVHAAALRALHLAWRPGLSLPASALSRENCRSEHLGTRTEALRLAAASSQDCADLSLADVLLLEPDQRVRRLVAAAIQATSPLSAELSHAALRCFLYDPVSAIQELCRAAIRPSFSPSLGDADRAATASNPTLSGLDHQRGVLGLSARDSVKPQFLGLFLWGGHPWTVVSDRRAMAWFPREPTPSLDLRFLY